MVSEKLTPLDEIKNCIKNKQNFVLQGGAGSGKTETLKRVLEYIKEDYPTAKVACITFTNLAVEEIKSRIGEDFTISTVHSFIYNLIKDYKKNIHSVIHEIFQLPCVDRKPLEYYTSKKEWNESEHNNYKKIYDKYENQLIKFKHPIELDKIGKTDYDKNYEEVNLKLNTEINKINIKIKNKVQSISYTEVHYSKTKFSRLKDLSFGHDDLLEVFNLLCKKFPKLIQIIEDKYDFILIDEYQDTNSNVIDILLKQLPKKQTIIGLFGDKMQSIYDNGIRNVDNYEKNGDLISIQKKDNYRCSQQVIDLITKLRNDNLEQEVALKKDECIADRQGSVKCYYTIFEKNVNILGEVEKRDYLETINKLINYALKDIDTDELFKILMLTNRSISNELTFPTLYNIFAERFIEPRKEIEEYLEKMQLLHLAKLCKAYQSKQYNYVLSELKKVGFKVNSLQDKLVIKKIFQDLIYTEKGAYESLIYGIDKSLIKSENSISELKFGELTLKELNSDTDYQNLKSKYTKGDRNFAKGNNLSQNKADHFKKNLAKEKFYMSVYNNELKFQEILNFYDYYIDETKYSTMHKTKGTSIKNVLLVLDKFFWNNYNFDFIFDKNADIDKKLINQKIMYVAASRTEKNLICVKLVKSSEVTEIKSFFGEGNTKEVPLTSVT